MVGNNIIHGSGANNQTNFSKRKIQAKTIKFKILIKSNNHDFPPNFRNKEAGMGFLIPKARLKFTKLRQVFVKAPIFYYFDPECNILIKTDAFEYASGEILSQLTLHDLGQ